MLKFINFLVCVALIFIISSCASPKFTNSLSGKYDHKTLTDPTTVLDVNVSVIPIPDPPAKVAEKVKTFFDLRDSIPNTYLQVVGARASTVAEIVTAIQSPLSVLPAAPVAAPPVGTNILNKNEVKLRFFFSNIKKYYNNKAMLHPNTRLEFLTTSLRVQSPGFTILSIDRLENEFEQIDMGTLERQQSVKFDANLSGEMGAGAGSDVTGTSVDQQGGDAKTSDTKNVYDESGKLIGTMTSSGTSTNNNTNTTVNKKTRNSSAGAKASMAYSNSETIKEALQLKFKRLRMGFSFNPKNITLSQRAVPLGDISDNVIVTATIRLDPDNLKMDTKKTVQYASLFAAGRVANPVSAITTTQHAIHYPPCYSSTNLVLAIDYSGAIRVADNLKRGRNTLEYDDKVTFYSFAKTNLPVNNIVIEKTGFCHNVYKIVAKLDSGEEFVLNKTTAVGDNEVLIYDDHNPDDFVEWIIKLIGTQVLTNFQSTELFTFINADGSTRIPLSKPGFAGPDLTNLNLLRYLGLVIRREN